MRQHSSNACRSCKLRLQVLVLICLRGASADSPQEPGFAIDQHLDGLGVVTAMAFAADGTLFLAEKGGELKVLPAGRGAPTLFASISVHTAGECGLLGLALGPDYGGFAMGGHVHVFATVSSSEQQILRFRDQDGTGVEPIVIKGGLPTLGANHNGGCLRLGSDGKLYLAIGDGDSGASRAQDLSSLFGKVLRLNLDGSIPADNPDFAAIEPNWRREIFAYGFRNPFRIALRQTGPAPTEVQVWVNDVGSSGSQRREEINWVQAGKNYGWPEVEGIQAQDARFESPVHAYHDEGSSIVGGVFYQGDRFPPAHRGNYFYMDYASGALFRAVVTGSSFTTTTLFAQSDWGVIDIAEGPDGALYYSASSGQVFRLHYAVPGNLPPVARLQASPANGAAPLVVALDASASTDADGTIERYDWVFGDGTAFLDGDAKVSHEFAHGGAITARVTVRDDRGSTASATAEISVTANNLRPVVEILEPATETKYDGGSSVRLVGRAIDAEDGELAGTSLSWDVMIVHPHHSHTHPLFEDLIGSEQSFILPAEGLAESWNVTVELTATDSLGQKTVVSRLVGLNAQAFELGTEPTGLTVKVEGAPITAPASFQSVQSAVLEVLAPSPQTLPRPLAGGPSRFIFSRWSDGEARQHLLTVTAGLKLTATFEPDPSELFRRGDANRDGALDISDPTFTLTALFLGAAAPACADSADANDDGRVDISDPVATLSSLFLGTGPLPAPATTPGYDPTADDLECN